MKTLRKTEYIIVFTLLMFFLFSSLVTTPFHVDEAQWIGTSVYLESLIHLDLNNPIWEPQYWTLNSPPLTRYIVGLGRLLSSIPASDVNSLGYDYDRSISENQAAGVVPSTQLLLAGRVPMVTITVFVVMFFYILLREKFPFPAAPIFILLFLFDEILLARLLSAMSEALLLGTVLLIAIAAYHTQAVVLRFLADPNNRKKRTQGYLWITLTGALLGLSAACKINAFSIGFIFPPLLIYWLYRVPNSLPTRGKITWLIRFFSVFVLASLAVFILVNPFLYHNPIIRIGMLLKWRLEELAFHIEKFPDRVIQGNLFQHWFFIFKKVLTEYGALKFRGVFWVNAALFVSGLIFVLLKIISEWKSKKGFSIFTMILVLASPLIVLALQSPLDWPRFFLFPMWFSLLFISLGIPNLMRWGSNLVKKTVLSKQF